MPKPVVLIGAEFEENLSLRYLAAAVATDGYAVELIPYNFPHEADGITARVADLDPLLVGISIPFQLRAMDQLGLAAGLREAGVRVPIVVGGHFATFEFEAIIANHPAIDAVVRHEGEATFQELVRHVDREGTLPDSCRGAIVRNGSGWTDDGKRTLPKLDSLAWPDRRGEPHTVLGVRTSPLVGSRGCYADCSFCCIFAYADNADGARYRMRSVEDIVAEMEREYHQRGVRLFVFHDDNFFVPSERRNLARYSHMKELLAAAEMTDIALVIKCRPNDVTPALFSLLKSMGMLRAYVGIETNSDEGVVSLNRRITSEDNARALDVFRSLDVYCSFNVLIFDPEATVEGVRRNLDFMERYAEIPFNFCRAEVYAGTPLKNILEHQGRLRGDYLAWNYEMRDERVELLFRVASTAFASRNFKSDGVHNLNLGIRFDNEVMRWFYPECWDAEWHRGVTDLSRRIGRDSVGHMRDALEFVSSNDPYDQGTVKQFTIDLARRVARADLGFVQQIRSRRAEMEHRIAERRGIEARQDRRSGQAPVWAAETARLGSSTGSVLSTEILPAPATAGAS